MIGWLAAPSGQQVRYVTRVLDLAHDLANPVPHLQHAAAGVAQCVCRDLADRQFQVIDPGPTESGRLGVAHRKLADLSEVVGEDQRIGVGRRWRQRGIAPRRHASRS